MIFITFNGVSSLLVLTEPDWEQGGPSVELTTPTDIAPSNYARESRRVFARSMRYTLSYPVQTQSVVESTAIRQALNIWKSQPVLCPLWTDAIELAVAVAPGSTSLVAADVPGLPARSGVDWIVLNEATQFYELVQVTAIVGSTLMLANGVFGGWPAGTRCYPILFGRFKDRPQFAPISGERMTGTFKVMEDSDYSRALWPQAPAPTLVGAAVPELAGLPLWNLPPDWVEPSDSSEADVQVVEPIGFGRQSERMDYPQAVRRKLTAMFTQGSRAMVAAVEKFWFDRRATTKTFAAPTWRSDLELAQDLVAGVTAITLQTSTWTNPAFTVHPGAPFLALIDDRSFAVEPIRVIEIDIGVVDLHAATAGTYAAATTLVSHLLLCRFSDDTLHWDYDAALRAQCTITMLEISGEYAAPIADLPEPVFLYDFSSTLPNGTVQAWKFTSYEAAVQLPGQATSYQPAPMTHGDLKSTLKLDQEKLVLKSFDFTGSPLRLFLPFSLEAPLLLSVSEADARDFTVAPIVRFAGEVWNLTPTGKEFQSDVIAFGRTFERKFPRVILQPQCNKTQYTAPCGLNPADWQRSGTVSSIDAIGTTVGISLSGLAAADLFAGGWMETGTGANQKTRAVLHNTALAGGNVTISLNRPCAGLAIGAKVTLQPSCANTRAGCQSFNNDANYLGFEFVPTQNPSIQGVPTSNNSGGGK